MAKNLENDRKIKKLIETFKIFTNKHRLEILKLLKMGEKSVGQIADHLEISFKATSKHLLFLSEKGILTRRYDGPFVLYSISKNISGIIQPIISKVL